MTVTYNTAPVKNNRLQNVIDAIGSKTYVVGSGTGSAGKLVIGTASLSGATGVLATITLQNPAFGTPAAGAMTLAGVPLSANATATGTAALAAIRTSADVDIITGLTVGTSATDIILTSTSITSGQQVTITSPSTITHG